MNRTKIQLSDHFTYGRLIRFTIPSMAMMIFTSIYGVVDGFFVSNYVGSTQFAALNLIMPFIMVIAALGTMFGSGGSALVAVKLGMGDSKKANEIFSLIIYTLLVLSSVLAVVGFIATPAVAKALGASDKMLPYCIIYARVNFIGLPVLMLQYAFQTFLITAERPQMGFMVTLFAGITNVILDWLFMGVFRMGLASAAAATVIGETVGGLIPLLYFFSSRNNSLLRLGKTHFDGGALFKAVTNGSSEFLSNVSSSVVNMLYNYQLMRFAGEDGVTAFGIIMYTNFIFIGIFFGYSMGASPIAGYNLGAARYDELKNVFQKSMKMIAIAGVVMTGISVLCAVPLAFIFESRNPELLALSAHAIRIYSFSYLFMGFNIYGSAFFTAMNNGPVSALISFMRTLVFQVLSVLLLPVLFGIDGIWGAVIVAEALSLAITVTCLVRYRNRYHYA